MSIVYEIDMSAAITSAETTVLYILMLPIGDASAAVYRRSTSVCRFILALSGSVTGKFATGLCRDLWCICDTAVCWFNC